MATALRPRSGVEIIDAAFAIVRAHFLPLITLSVATHLPALATRLWISVAATETPIGLGGWVLRFVAYLLEFASALPVIAAASQCYLGDTYDAAAAVRRGLKRFVPSLLASISYLLMVILGVIVFIVPGLYLWLRFVPLHTVAVLEDGPPMRIVSRTWELTHEEVQRVLLVALPQLAIIVAVYFLNRWVLGSIASGVETLRHASVYAIYYAALAAIMYPVVHALNVVLYYDLRIRKEGFDLALISRELDAPAAV